MKTRVVPSTTLALVTLLELQRAEMFFSGVERGYRGAADFINVVHQKKAVLGIADHARRLSLKARTRAIVYHDRELTGRDY